MFNKTEIEYRRARKSDLYDIQKFVDFWLSGRAKSQGIKNSGNDYFVTINQHKSYLRNYIVYLALENKKIIGWGVKERSNVLIHLLIAADKRGLGIGAKLLKLLNPDVIRSKSDQQTGDPASFYEKYGYMRISDIKIGRKENIEFMVKKIKR